MRALIRILAALWFWISLPGFAPQGATPEQAPPLAKRPASPAPPNGRRITLEVVVTDHSGNPVPGLQQQDFTLLDDKLPQTITSFEAFDAAHTPTGIPLQCVVLIDSVNTSFNGIASQRTGLDAFFRQGGGELPMPTSLALLTDKSGGQSPATQDGNALAQALAAQQSELRTITRSQGYYGAVERLQLSLAALDRLISSLQTQPGIKLVIWLGPGWPLLSGPNVQLSAKDQDQLFQSVVRLSTEMREARIEICNVNPIGAEGSMLRESYYEGFLKGVASAKSVQSGNLGLQVLAVQSGGRVLNSSSDEADSINLCLADRKTFYVLTFDSPPADRPNEYHTLQIKIGKPRLTAHTRAGYYAQP